MHRVFMLLGLIVCASATAYAEGDSSREGLPSTPDRLVGTSSVMPLPNGGLASAGGSSLRVLMPGARAWRTLFRLPNHELYRVAANDRGELLAYWESDTSIHFFAPASNRQITLPLPPAPSGGITQLGLQYLGFGTTGRDAVVRMEGSVAQGAGPRRGTHWISMTYRVPLDPGVPAQLLYTVDAGQLVQMGNQLAVYLVPLEPGAPCDAHNSCDYASVVAYEITERGVVQKTLMTRDRARIAGARRIAGSNDDRVCLLIANDGSGRARGLLSYRRGDAAAEYRSIPGLSDRDNRLMVTRAGALIELVKLEDELEIRHYGSDLSVTTIRLHEPSDLEVIDTDLHGMGERSDGTLWAHWGDYVLLWAPGKAPRASTIAPLLGRRDEWASADLYVASPEALWIGIEIGRGRDFARVPFAQVEKQAKPWPTY